MTTTTMDSPVGELTLVADDGGLAGVYFPHHWYRPDPATFGCRADAGFGEVKSQLTEYFARERQRFDLRLNARGDDFQRRVWELIGDIPYGQTVTYGDLARELGLADRWADLAIATWSSEWNYGPAGTACCSPPTGSGPIPTGRATTASSGT